MNGLYSVAQSTDKKVSSYVARDKMFKVDSFTSWQTCSTEYHRDFSGKHSATLCKDYSYANIILLQP